ncbi:MAG: hypothetical protein ABR909_11105 [Candidatus Bathyarchaeia archaeon]
MLRAGAGTCEPLRERVSHPGAQVEEVYIYESGLPLDKKLKDKFFQDLTSGDNQNQRILHAKCAYSFVAHRC